MKEKALTTVLLIACAGGVLAWTLWPPKSKEMTDLEVFGALKIPSVTHHAQLSGADLFADLPQAPKPKPAETAFGRLDPPLTFMGYTCTKDCSGHRAGYRWAERKGIDDADDCTGNSRSFIEGCKAYVEENE